MQHVLKPELRIAASPALIARGCVVIIGLDHIRAEAGARWERMRESIYAHLETLLRQKLGGADFFSQIDDNSFLITMPSATGDEAQVLCLRVAHELHTNLLGHCEPSQLKIARATRMEGETLECEPTTGAELARLAKLALYMTEESGSSPRNQKGAAVQEPVFPIKYVPIWDVQNEAITTYRCITIAEAFIPGIASPQAQFKTNLNALLRRLRMAAATLAQRLSAGERFLVSLPITYDMLSSSVARMEVTSLCRGLAASMRPYLQFEISELPVGVPQSRLSELAGSLHPFCRSVWAHVPARTASYGAYQGAGLHAIGLSLAPAALRPNEFEREITSVCTAAARMRAKTFVLDVPNLDTLLLARELKVRMIGGNLIGAPMDEPAPIRRLHMSDILRNADSRRSSPDCSIQALAM